MEFDDWREVRLPDGFAWPGSARIAVALTFDFQGVIGLPRTHSGVRPDLRLETEHVYETRVGIHRVLEILARHEVPGTFPTCGATVELNPGTCHEMLQMGHELAAHGYDHEKPNMLTEPEEAAIIERTTRTFERVLRVTPRGWRCPYYLATHATTRLLCQAGYRWQSDYHDDDLPYRLQSAAGSIVEIPPQIDDWPRYWSDVESKTPSVRGDPRAILSVLIDAFDVLYRESDRSPKLFCATLHPQIVGRPDRAIILDGFLGHARPKGGIWWATCGEIADLVEERTQVDTATRAGI